MSDPAVQLLASGDVARAGELWRELEASLADPPLCRGWEWTAAWLSRYGDVVPHRFALVERGGATIGAALVTSSRAGGRAELGMRRLHLGTAGEPEGEGIFVEYNGLLAAPADRVAVARGILAALAAERGWDELRLDGFELDDAAAFAAAAPSLKVGEVASPCTDLAAIRAAGGEVLGALAKGPRSRIRRSLRGMGAVAGEWATGLDAGRAIFDELVGLHQERWLAAGMPGAFASRRAVGFHRDLIEALLPSGRVVLYRVHADGGTVACIYGMVDRNRLLFYQSGVVELADQKLKPGLVAHALCMQACLEHGLDGYDFLAGDARYKRELATGERRIAWGTLSRRRPRPLLSLAARRLARRPRPLTPFE
jgi:CelD/BcsL family acetyltransferase involved in cellulose biosynthesis